MEPVGIALLGAGAAIAGGMLNGALDQVVRWIWKPALRLSYHGTPEHKVDCTANNTIYVRIKIDNVGRSVARGCRIYIAKIERIVSGRPENTPFVDPMPLQFPPNDFGPRDIPRNMYFYADVFRISKRESGWVFAFTMLLGHAGMEKFRGTYRFTLIATADNAEPTRFQFDADYNGDWNNLSVVSVGGS